MYIMTLWPEWHFGKSDPLARDTLAGDVGIFNPYPEMYNFAPTPSYVNRLHFKD